MDITVSRTHTECESRHQMQCAAVSQPALQQSAVIEQRCGSCSALTHLSACSHFDSKGKSQLSARWKDDLIQHSGLHSRTTIRHDCETSTQRTFEFGHDREISTRQTLLSTVLLLSGSALLPYLAVHRYCRTLAVHCYLRRVGVRVSSALLPQESRG